jgi:hypothetical protein
MHVGDQTYYEDLIDKIKANPVKADILLRDARETSSLLYPS